MINKTNQQQVEPSLAALEGTIRKLTNNVFAAMLMVKKMSEASEIRQQQFEASLSDLTGSVGRIEESIRLISRHLGI